MTRNIHFEGIGKVTGMGEFAEEDRGLCYGLSQENGGIIPACSLDPLCGNWVNRNDPGMILG